MRQFKFRVWDKKREKMCYCGSLEFISSCLPMLDIQPYAVYGQMHTPAGLHNPETKYDESNKQFVNNNQEDFEIQQFTGVKDVNGVDIYEGDIVQYTQHLFNTDKTYVKTKVIKYDERIACFNIYETEAGQSDHIVIGNIFEGKK